MKKDKYKNKISLATFLNIFSTLDIDSCELTKKLLNAGKFDEAARLHSVEQAINVIKQERDLIISLLKEE